jgi:hypothetical protein
MLWICRCSPAATSALRFANVLAVFPDRVAGFDVFQRDFVADRNVSFRLQLKGRVVLGDQAEHVGAGSEVLDHDHAARVLWTMNQKMGNAHPLSSLINLIVAALAAGSGVLLPQAENAKSGHQRFEPS